MPRLSELKKIAESAKRPYDGSITSCTNQQAFKNSFNPATAAKLIQLLEEAENLFQQCGGYDSLDQFPKWFAKLAEFEGEK